MIWAITIHSWSALTNLHQLHSSSFIKSNLNSFCVSSLSSVDPTDQKKTACYDIDVEVDDPLKGQMNSFLSSTTNQQEIAALEMKVRTANQSQMPTPH